MILNRAKLLVLFLFTAPCCTLGFFSSVPLQSRQNLSSKRIPVIKSREQSSSSLSVATSSQQQQQTGVTELTTKREFLSFIDNINLHNNDNNRNNEFQMIKYYASYCKVCQRIKPLYKRIANSEIAANVSFGSVEVSVIGDTPTLETLGLTKLPFIQIYQNKKCVASFSTGGQTYTFKKQIKSTLSSCKERSPEEWHEFLTTYQTDIEGQRKGVDDLWRSLAAP